MNENGAGAQGMDVAEPAWFDATLHYAAMLIELAGVAVIAFGILAAVAIFAMALSRGVGWAKAYHRLRTSLARGILLGLEFLVAADIIGTVAVEPTLDNLYALGLIVIIRTFLSFSLEVEIEGRWPWQKPTDPADSISRHG
ncbi:DUF1622 domain-containing protein [Indioceanicola profundi]|uniref:DUF1622 domain-containing protein n=1 Tax=Indioceanicola profundi TaxID=2220096 RepID=UPI0019696F65|nr:DUF1622 domain-containing protein [Indioceanicola profundi]